MSLTAKDKSVVKTFWDKTASRADDIGAEALARMFAAFPATKTYFAHFSDLGASSPAVKKHGKTIMAAVADAVGKMDNLNAGLSELSDVHATKLRIDPSNFKILSHCMLVSLAGNFPADFTPEVHVAVDKFLAALSAALSDKYR